MLIDTILLLFFAASGLILYKLMLKKKKVFTLIILLVSIFFSRLILAMDPKYGEISRAMRNRGVEIFMLGEVR